MGHAIIERLMFAIGINDKDITDYRSEHNLGMCIESY
jgi:hypothetical protein